MTILVVGATGATGRLLVQQLLERGHHVKAVVRSAERLPGEIQSHANLTLVEAALLDLAEAELVAQVRDCTAVASCLGHTLSFKGMFGQPRRLVTEATSRLCRAIKAGQPAASVRFVLMSTAGNRNRDLHESVSLAHQCVVGLLRWLLPPHADNEQAAEYLRTVIGQNDPMIEWAAVRPDGLVNESAVSTYELHASPTRSAIFDAGQTSRINVAHFMAELITSESTWTKWKGQMPVIYNQSNNE